MTTKIFDGKKITIKPISKKDIRSPKKFQDFINSLVEEKTQITVNKKVSFKEEINWIRNNIRSVKKHRKVLLIAEHGNIIVGVARIDLYPGRQNHVGELGISIRREYRRIGLGSYLVEKIIKLAKRKLKPPPKIIRLSVFTTNKPAITLYKKFGFKRVAKIPKQVKLQGKLIDEVIMLLYL